MTNSSIRGDKLIKKWKKGSGYCRARAHLAKCSNFKKKSREKLIVGVVVHSFNKSVQKVEALGSLSVCPAWSTDQIQ